MSDKVLKLEDVLQISKVSGEKNSNSIVKKKVKKKKKSDKLKSKTNTDNSVKTITKDSVKVPRGRSVSGRVWKTQKKRFSSVIKTRGYKTANRFEKLQALKKERNRMRDLSRTIVEERKRVRELQKEARKKNLERKEANRLKSEIVQVIKNPAKIKRMKKKQLRKIEKRDTLKLK